MELQSVSVESLGMGAAIERLNDCFAEVLENVFDFNTKADAVREIKLSVKIKPTKDRQNASYKIQVNTKLASPKEVEGLLFIGKNGGRLQAFEQNPDQIGMFQPEDIVGKEVSENDR